MRIRKTKNNHKKTSSALVLVVVVTALLSVIGVIFVMTMRMREMTTSNITGNRDLDAAVHSTVGQIGTILVQDLFGTSLNKSIIDGTSGNEPYDSLGTNDRWLASLEPDATTWKWPYITDLSNGTVIPLPSWNKASVIIHDYQAASDVKEGYPADADGDGVADSMWIKLPNLSTSKAKPVFAAVRIVDNCAMLNLNVAYCFYQDAAVPKSSFEKTWYVNQIAATNSPPIPYGEDPYKPEKSHCADGGRYLSELNYFPILRGSDLNFLFGWYNILVAKKMATVNGTGALTPPYRLPDYIHNNVSMKIENPGATYSLFDIGDELEIRNRFLMTSKTESRFERHDVANYSLDAGGAVYGALEIPRDSTTDSDGISNFTKWKWRIDPRNFDAWGGAFNGTWNGQPLDNRFKYDRRHVCTFYSFDRNIRTAQTTFYTFLDSQSEAIRYVFVPKNKMAITTNIKDMTASLPYNNKETRRKILHLLYAFREYFKNERGLTQNKAAIQAAQIVANLIDYLDDNTTATTGPFGNSTYGSQTNSNPTYINKAIVDAMVAEVSGNNPVVVGNAAFDFGLTASDIVYGYERQPFISEIYTRVDDSGVVDRFAIELYNPYSQDINVESWKLRLEGQTGNLLQEYSFSTGVKVVGGGRLVVRSSTLIPATGTIIESNIFGTSIKNAYKIRLIAKDPVTGTVGLVVDQLRRDDNDPNKDQILLMTTDVKDNLLTHHSLKRGDRSWKFCNANAVVHQSQNLSSSSDPGITNLGSANSDYITVSVSSSVSSYSLPVANDSLPIERLADFEKIAFIGNQKTGTDPNTITDLVGKASAGSRGEADVRFDITSDGRLLNYICALNRSQGNLPGRININTAPKYVIAAAIPPQLIISAGDPNTPLTLANDIINNRPYASLGDLLKIQAMRKYLGDTDNSRNLGDQGINDDLEERDWIFNRLSNIFTVRSDTFTAYILVRLGTDGPQRRMLAIFDRSNVWSSADKPKLVALHPVPDPR